MIWGLRVPFSIVAPVILVLCTIAAFAMHSSVLDVVIILGFGALDCVFKRSNCPLAPLVLAIVLENKAEEAFRQSLLSSQGSMGIFFANGLVGTVMTLGLVALFDHQIGTVWAQIRATR